MAAGIVLTGGTSKMEGVIELAEEIFHMPVRLGAPQNVSGLADIVNNPIYATGVGLLHYAQQLQKKNKGYMSVKDDQPSILERIKKWFQGGM